MKYIEKICQNEAKIKKIYIYMLKVFHIPRLSEDTVQFRYCI